MKPTRVTDAMLEDWIVSARPDRWIVVVFTSFDMQFPGYQSDIDGLAAKLGETADLLQIDVGENPGVTEFYGLEALPTYVIFRDYEEKARYEGPYSQKALFERLQALMAPKERKSEMQISLYVNEGIFSIVDEQKPDDALLEMRFTGDWRKMDPKVKLGMATAAFRAIEQVASKETGKSTDAEPNDTKEVHGGDNDPTK